MNLLVIGGSGILSTAVVDEAVRKGINVTMVNRGRRKLFINSQAELIIGDVRNNPKELLEKLKDRHFDAVIDFLVWTKEDLENSLFLFSELAEQYVFISSAQVYNTSINEILTEKSEMVQPLWKYSVNKYKAEQYLIEYCKENHKTYTIIRPGVNYGATRIPYGIFPSIGMHWTFIERIKAGKIIPIWNNGENVLNLTRVEDLACGTVGLIGNKKAYNEDFNVVGDYVYSWKQVLLTLGEILGVDVKTIDVPVDYYASYLRDDEREGLLGGRSKNLVCSNDKLKSVVPSFQTEFDLETGLRMTIKAYQENSYYMGIDYYYEGKTDRMLNDYRSKSHSSKQSFINYFKNEPSIKNRLRYLMAYYESSPFVKVLNRLR